MLAVPPGSAMLVVLPFAALGLLIVTFRLRGDGWRAAAIRGAVGWACLAVAFAEVLSVGRLLTRPALAIAWALVALACAAACWLTPRRQAAAASGGGTEAWRLMPIDWILVLGTGALVGLVGVTAIVAPPNTWDVLQYHMPRVVHWIQNHSVGLYATHEMKQLHMGPGAEYLVLQLHVLAGGDRFDNMIQWLAYVGSVSGVSLLAQALGGSPRAQVLAGVIAATIPQGILQASGAKNDYVLAYWMVALVFYLLRFQREPGRGNPIGTGMALGLCLLTKATAYIMAAPLLAACFAAGPSHVRRAIVRAAPAVALVALALNGPQYSRNVDLYGSPIGPGYEGTVPSLFKYSVDTLSPTAALSGVLRNVGLHMSMPSDAMTDRIGGRLNWLVLRIGADPNDPATTWTGVSFHVPRANMHESRAGNPMHLLLIVLTLPLLVMLRSMGPLGAALWLAAGLVLAFIAFAGLLKWQPWHSRLHLPLFVLWSPVIACAIGRTPLRVLSPLIAAGLLALAFPVALGNELRPIAADGDESILRRPRARIYFSEVRHLEPAFSEAASLVARTGCRHVGLNLSSRVGDQLEYTLMALLGAERGERTVRGLGVVDRSGARAPAAVVPCAVICVSCPPQAERAGDYGRIGDRVTVSDAVVVYVPRGRS